MLNIGSRERKLNEIERTIKLSCTSLFSNNNKRYRAQNFRDASSYDSCCKHAVIQEQKESIDIDYVFDSFGDLH